MSEDPSIEQEQEVREESRDSECSDSSSSDEKESSSDTSEEVLTKLSEECKNGVVTYSSDSDTSDDDSSQDLAKRKSKKKASKEKGSSEHSSKKSKDVSPARAKRESESDSDDSSNAKEIKKSRNRRHRKGTSNSYSSTKGHESEDVESTTEGSANFDESQSYTRDDSSELYSECSFYSKDDDLSTESGRQESNTESDKSNKQTFAALSKSETVSEFTTKSGRAKSVSNDRNRYSETMLKKTKTVLDSSDSSASHTHTRTKSATSTSTEQRPTRALSSGDRRKKFITKQRTMITIRSFRDSSKLGLRREKSRPAETSLMFVPLVTKDAIPKIELHATSVEKYIASIGDITVDNVTCISAFGRTTWHGFADGCVHAYEKGKLKQSFYANVNSSPIISIIYFDKETPSAEAGGKQLSSSSTALGSSKGTLCVVSKSGLVTLYGLKSGLDKIGEWTVPGTKENVVFAGKALVTSQELEGVVVATSSGVISVYDSTGNVLCFLSTDISTSHPFVYCTFKNFLMVGWSQYASLINLKTLSHVGDCRLTHDKTLILTSLVYSDNSIWAIFGSDVLGWTFGIDLVANEEVFTLIPVYTDDVGKKEKVSRFCSVISKDETEYSITVAKDQGILVSKKSARGDELLISRHIVSFKKFSSPSIIVRFSVFHSRLRRSTSLQDLHEKKATDHTVRASSKRMMMKSPTLVKKDMSSPKLEAANKTLTTSSKTIRQPLARVRLGMSARKLSLSHTSSTGDFKQNGIMLPLSSPFHSRIEKCSDVKPTCVQADPARGLLYCCSGAAFNVIDGKTLKKSKKTFNFPLKKSSYITCIKMFGPFIWCGSSEGKLYVYNPVTEKIKELRVTDEPSSILSMDFIETETTSVIYVSTETQKEHRLNIGTIRVKDGKENELKEIIWKSKKFEMPITCVSCVSKNRLWIGFLGKIWILNVEENTFFKRISLKHLSDRVIIIPNGNLIWVGCSNNIFVFSQTTEELVASFFITNKSPIVSLHSYDTNCIISAASDGEIACWVPATYSVNNVNKHIAKDFINPIPLDSTDQYSDSKYWFRGFRLLERRVTADHSLSSLKVDPYTKVLVVVAKDNEMLVFVEAIKHKRSSSSQSNDHIAIAPCYKGVVGKSIESISKPGNKSFRRIGFSTMRKTRVNSVKIISPFSHISPRSPMSSPAGPTVSCVYVHNGVLYLATDRGTISAVSLFTEQPLPTCPNPVTLPLSSDIKKINHLYAELNTLWVATHEGKVLVLDCQTLEQLQELSPFASEDDKQKNPYSNLVESTAKAFCSISGFLTKICILFTTETSSAIVIYTLGGNLIKIITLSAPSRAMAFSDGRIFVAQHDTIQVYNADDEYALVKTLATTSDKFLSPLHEQTMGAQEIISLVTMNGILAVLKSNMLIAASVKDLTITTKQSIEVEHPNGAKALIGAASWIVTVDEDGVMYSWSSEMLSIKGHEPKGTPLNMLPISRLRSVCAVDFSAPYCSIKREAQEKIKKEDEEVRRKSFMNEGPKNRISKTTIPVHPSPALVIGFISKERSERYCIFKKTANAIDQGDGFTNDDPSYQEYYSRKWKEFKELYKIQTSAFYYKNCTPEIIKVQSYIRRFLTDLYVKSQRKRMKQIEEFVETEQSYVKYLTLLRDFIVLPLQKSGALTSDEILNVFLNYDEIIENSTIIEKKLKEIIPQKQAISEIKPFGQVFKTLLYNILPHIWYVANSSFSMMLLANVRKRPEVSEIIRQGEKAPEFSGISLSDVLIMPVQRLMRYDMLLGEIIKLTRRDDSGLQTLIECRMIIKKIAAYTNKVAGKKDKMADVAKTIESPESLEIPSRFLLFDGSLTTKKNSKADGHGYLFNNLLVLTKPIPKTKMNKILQMFTIDEDITIESSDGKVGSEVFGLSRKDEKIALKAQSFEEKMIWLTNITTLTQDKEYQFSRGKYAPDDILNEIAKIQ